MARRRTGRAEKQSREASIAKSTRPPKLSSVYAAFNTKKINEEEAKNLNPKFNPSKIYGKSNVTQATHHNTYTKSAKAFTPSMSDIKAAHAGNHINLEEAQDLNPKYNPLKNVPSGGHIPSLTDVHKAYSGGHIDWADAVNLNPEYKKQSKRESAERSVQASYAKKSTRVSHSQFNGA